MKSRRVLIVCEHRLFGEVIQRILNGKKGIRVVGVVQGTGSLAESIGKLQPDVVILDAEPGSDSHGAVLMALESAPHSRAICLTMEDNRMRVRTTRCIENASADDLVAAIHGERSLSERWATKGAKKAGSTAERERGHV